jgi:hypothetical protein
MILVRICENGNQPRTKNEKESVRRKPKHFSLSLSPARIYKVYKETKQKMPMQDKIIKEDIYFCAFYVYTHKKKERTLKKKKK